MKYSYEYQLVLQWPAVSLRDYDELIELESRIISEIGTLAEVDGHDMGVGEMNIFIHTDHPKLAFEKIKSLAGTKDFMSGWRSVTPGYTHLAWSVLKLRSIINSSDLCWPRDTPVMHSNYRKSLFVTGEFP